jgi:hypothetical protein
MRRKRIMLAVVCIAILAGPVAAETPYLEPFVLRETLSDKVLSVPLLSYICLKHDWDGDGTPELLVGQHYGRIFVLTNANPPNTDISEWTETETAISTSLICIMTV